MITSNKCFHFILHFSLNSQYFLDYCHAETNNEFEKVTYMMTWSNKLASNDFEFQYLVFRFHILLFNIQPEEKFVFFARYLKFFDDHWNSEMVPASVNFVYL